MHAAPIAAPSQPMASTPVMAAVAGDEFQARDLQHRMQLLQVGPQRTAGQRSQLNLALTCILACCNKSQPARPVHAHTCSTSRAYPLPHSVKTASSNSKRFLTHAGPRRPTLSLMCTGTVHRKQGQTHSHLQHAVPVLAASPTPSHPGHTPTRRPAPLPLCAACLPSTHVPCVAFDQGVLSIITYNDTWTSCSQLCAIQESVNPLNSHSKPASSLSGTMPPACPQVQVQDYERVKAQLAQEQRSAAEWREKWNFQNLKLNMMVREKGWLGQAGQRAAQGGRAVR